MIRVLVLLLCSSFFYSANAQVLTKPNWYGLELARGQINTWLRIPSDTTANKEGIARIGTTIYAGNGTYWTAASGGGGSTTLQGAIDNSPLLDKDNAIDGGGNNLTFNNSPVFNITSTDSIVINNSNSEGIIIGDVYNAAGGATLQVNKSIDSIIAKALEFKIANSSGVGMLSVSDATSSTTISTDKVYFDKYPDTLTSNFSQIGRDITTGKIGVIAGGGGGSGTVTSVATGYGLSGGTITTSGTLLVDSATLSTKYLRITDTANMRVRLVAGTNITNISGTYPNLTINAATQTTDTTSLSSRINLKANIASPTFTGTPILPTGTIATTQSAGNNSTAIATTAYADAADNTKWSLASGGTLTGTNTITAGTNPLILSTGVTTGTGATAGHQIVANSLTSGNANDYSSSSLTAGSILKLTSTSTAANAFSLLNINSSGANASSTRKAIGQVISVTNTGTTSTNIGLISNTSGASNNYSILVQNGNVGFGLNPQERLSVMANSRSTYAQRWYDTDSTIVAGIYVGGTGAGTFELYDASGNVGFQLSNTAASYFNGTGGVGINQLTPTARLHIGAGTATANTAPLKFTSGTNLTTVENGSIEYDGTDYYASAGGTRQTINKGKSGSVSQTGTATTTFTVTFGGTQPNATYKVNVTPTNNLSAALFYVTNKTTTTFDVMYLAGLTGTVAFDYLLTQ